MLCILLDMGSSVPVFLSLSLLLSWTSLGTSESDRACVRAVLEEDGTIMMVQAQDVLWEELKYDGPFW